MKVPIKVVYLGAANQTEAIWSAHTKRAGALVYNFYPNVNQHKISILHLPRAKIPPYLDFQPQRITVFLTSIPCDLFLDLCGDENGKKSEGARMTPRLMI